MAQHQVRFTINIPDSRNDVLGFGISRQRPPSMVDQTIIWVDFYVSGRRLYMFLRTKNSKRWFRILPRPCLIRAEVWDPRANEHREFREGRGWKVYSDFEKAHARGGCK